MLVVSKWLDNSIHWNYFDTWQEAEAFADDERRFGATATVYDNYPE
jgi:hypothetical protein